jgi:hypothetical protein
MVDGAFDRDLGYLDLFFTKLEAHARTLGAAPQAELLRLLAEERTRWAEIRRLLSGGTPKALSEAIAPAGGLTPPMTGPGAPPPAPHRLTVGSLMGVGQGPPRG